MLSPCNLHYDICGMITVTLREVGNLVQSVLLLSTILIKLFNCASSIFPALLINYVHLFRCLSVPSFLFDERSEFFSIDCPTDSPMQAPLLMSSGALSYSFALSL